MNTMDLGNNTSLRVAIIGSGPSGFYAADALFKASINVEVDIFDKLPTPFGLLRTGVAPDHQKIKSLAKYFTTVYTKNKGKLNFYGNIEIGSDISRDDLHLYYDAIICCYGSEDSRQLGIPGEFLDNIYPIRPFVLWYNGHPEFSETRFDLNTESVAIIGVGNVAIDVIRMLSQSHSELAKTDIAPYALRDLKDNSVKTIHLCARRGPIQAAFSPLELEELKDIKGLKLTVSPEDLVFNEKELDIIEESKSIKKNIELLTEFSQTTNHSANKELIFHFYKVPHECKSSSGKAVEELVLQHTSLKDGKLDYLDEYQTIQVQAVYKSIGFLGKAIRNFPFDTNTHTMPNVKGRVTDSKGLYTAGWIKRGPKGVIGTNKSDAKETVESLLEDLNSLKPAPNRKTRQLVNLLKSKGKTIITFEDWEVIDKHELLLGEKENKVRHKLIELKTIIDILNKETSLTT